MRLLRALRYFFDWLSYRYEGHWPDDYLDCPADCKRCARIQRRNDRIYRYLHEHELPRARLRK